MTWCPRCSRSAWRIFLMLHRERGHKTWKSNKCFVWKNSCLLLMGPFWPKNDTHPDNSVSSLRIFFKVLLRECPREFVISKRCMKIILMGFLKKILFRGNWSILESEIAHPYKSGSALICFLILHIEISAVSLLWYHYF